MFPKQAIIERWVVSKTDQVPMKNNTKEEPALFSIIPISIGVMTLIVCTRNKATRG